MKALKILGLVLLLASPLLSQPPGPPISPGSSGGSGTVTNTDATCADTQIIRADGASNTATQCSVLTVADTTGNITGPAGGFTITGGTAATDDLILDGSAGTAGYVKVTQAGEIFVGSPGYVLIAGYAGVVIDGDAVLGSNNAGYFSRVGTDLGVVSFGDAASALLYGVAGGVIEQRNTTTQQTHRIYNTADDYPTTTNYERLSLTGVAGTSVDIKAETAGTGADDLDINLTSAGNGGVAFRRKVKVDIDGETTTLAQSGWVWTNTGDGDGEAITLLNDPGIGVQYCFAVDVAQTITVAPSTGETLYYGTDNCVASLTSNAIGSTLCVTAITGGSGAKWFTMSHEGSWTCND